MRTLLTAAIYAAAIGTLCAYEPDSSRVKHPVAKHILKDTSATAKMKNETLLERIGPLEGLSDSRIRGMISEMNGFRGCRCPKCKEFGLALDLRDPERIKCTDCGTVYPNEELPCDRTVEATNPLGKQVAYRVRIDKGYQYFIPAKIRRERHQALSSAALAAAWLYHRTGDEKQARLALVIMDRFAEVYPGWCVHRDHSWWEKYIVEKRPWPYFGGKWSNWFHLDMPIDLVLVYDLIYDSQAIKDLDASTDYSVRRRVEGFFRSAYDFIMESKEDHGMTVGNMTPYTCRHLIAAGRVIDDPEMIHPAVWWMRRLCEELFFFDGMWHEGALGYHGQATWNLSRAARALRGYCDPEGYVDNKHGLKLRGTDFYEDYPFMAQVAKAPYRMLYPDGSWYRVHDTGWTRKTEPPDYLNIELNAYGHFAIGGGTGDDVMQAHLHFCPLTWVSHYHQDRLNMTLFAAGREMISDIGYARTKHRYFATGQIGHNLVAVDWTRPPRIPKDIEHSPSTPTRVNNYPRSSLLAYDPGATSDRRVQLIEAEAPNAFCTDLIKYRRALLLIAANEKSRYLVDLFRVEGGAQHDWLLHGTCDEDMTMSTDAKLTPMPGTLASPEGKYAEIVRGAPGYSWLVDGLRSTDASKGLKFTWTGQESKAALTVWLLPVPGATAIFGQAPSYHRAGRSYADVDKYKMPFLDVRKPGTAPSSTTFVAVHDVAKAGDLPLVTGVERLPLEPSDPWATALSVRSGARRDIIYASLDDIPRSVAGHTCAGRFAVISSLNGTTDYVYGWGFRRVEFPEGQLMARPTESLRVVGTSRVEDGDECNGLIVEGAPPAMHLDQTWARVVHGDGTAHGYALTRAKTFDGGRTLLLTRGDPGFRITEKGMKLAKFPHWAIDGENRLEVFNSAWVKWETGGAPKVNASLVGCEARRTE